jgi:hypothetical protein
MSNQINFSDLSAPFAPEDLEFRAGATTADKTKALALAYITSRAVMNRLDEVVGPANWRDQYAPGPDGGVICGLSLRIDGEWITKWDGAENTNFEAVKGGLSDALKRVAVKWGIGRYLYATPPLWVPCQQRGKTVVIDQQAARNMFVRAVGSQAPVAPQIPQGIAVPAPSPQPVSAPTNGGLQPAPRPNGNGNGKQRDPMTAFWSAVNAQGLSREKGQNLLREAGGDPTIALARLQAK